MLRSAGCGRSHSALVCKSTNALSRTGARATAGACAASQNRAKPDASHAARAGRSRCRGGCWIRTAARVSGTATRSRGSVSQGLPRRIPDSSPSCSRNKCLLPYSGGGAHSVLGFLGINDPAIPRSTLTAWPPLRDVGGLSDDHSATSRSANVDQVASSSLMPKERRYRIVVEPFTERQP